MIQLNPMLPLWHVASAQPCDAFALIDYSQEHDLMFAVIRRDGQIWVCRASELRGQENVTLGRAKASDGESRMRWDAGWQPVAGDEIPKGAT